MANTMKKKLQKEIVVLCGSLLLLPSVFPSIRVFSDESALCIRWPKYWSFTFSINFSRVFSSTIIWKHQFFYQPSLLSNSHTSTLTSFLFLHSIHLPFGTQRRSRKTFFPQIRCLYRKSSWWIWNQKNKILQFLSFLKRTCIAL